MSTRSLVERQRDHSSDRGKPVSAAMVNDVPETERDVRTCAERYPGGFLLGEWGIE